MRSLMVEVPRSIINGWTKGFPYPNTSGALWLAVARQRLRTVDDLGHAAASGRVTR